MNKGFILEGFPRSPEDAKEVFMDKTLKTPEDIEGSQENAGTPEDAEPQYDYTPNNKIMPQYCISLGADDGDLTNKSKELPPEKVEGTHWNDAGMVRRLKDFRTRNTEENNIKNFMVEMIGHENVLDVDAMAEESEILGRMKEIIEQKGAPCCINMITDSDRKFLDGLKRAADKEARRKAREEAAKLLFRQSRKVLMRKRKSPSSN